MLPEPLWRCRRIAKLPFAAPSPCLHPFAWTLRRQTSLCLADTLPNFPLPEHNVAKRPDATPSLCGTFPCRADTLPRRSCTDPCLALPCLALPSHNTTGPDRAEASPCSTLTVTRATLHYLHLTSFNSAATLYHRAITLIEVLRAFCRFPSKPPPTAAAPLSKTFQRPIIQRPGNGVFRDPLRPFGALAFQPANREHNR